MIKFSFLNIPVTIHPSFLLFFLFFTGMYEAITLKGLIIGGILFVSLLVHEYGHALTAVYFGAKAEVNLEAFGGNAKHTSFGITPKQDCIITINGPLFESILIVISYILLKTPIAQNPIVYFILYKTMKLNIFWCIFNLIPVIPLDGGHILKYVLESWFGDKGLKAALLIGIASMAIGSTYYFLEGYYFFAGILLIYGFRSFQKGQIIPQTLNPFKLYTQGVEFFENAETEKAKDIFKKLMSTNDLQIRTWSTEHYAEILHREKRSREAYKRLMNLDPKYLHKGKKLLCTLAFDYGNYSLVKKYSRDLYEIDPSFETAILNSKAFAALNDSQLAGGWFKTASMFQTKTKNELDSILDHRSFDCVRHKEEFRKQLVS